MGVQLGWASLASIVPGLYMELWGSAADINFKTDLKKWTYGKASLTILACWCLPLFLNWESGWKHFQGLTSSVLKHTRNEKHLLTRLISG